MSSNSDGTGSQVDGDVVSDGTGTLVDESDDPVSSLLVAGIVVAVLFLAGIVILVLSKRRASA